MRDMVAGDDSFTFRPEIAQSLIEDAIRGVCCDSGLISVSSPILDYKDIQVQIHVTRNSDEKLKYPKDAYYKDGCFVESGSSYVEMRKAGMPKMAKPGRVSGWLMVSLLFPFMYFLIFKAWAGDKVLSFKSYFKSE